MFNTSAYYRYGIQKFELVSISPTVGSNLLYRGDITFTLTFNQNLNNDVGGSGFACGLEYVSTGETNNVFVFPESIIGNTFSVSFSGPTGGLHPLGPAIFKLPANTLYGNINNNFFANLNYNYTIVSP